MIEALFTLVTTVGLFSTVNSHVCVKAGLARKGLSALITTVFPSVNLHVRIKFGLTIEDFPTLRARTRIFV